MSDPKAPNNTGNAEVIVASNDFRKVLLHFDDEGKLKDSSTRIRIGCQLCNKQLAIANEEMEMPELDTHESYHVLHCGHGFGAGCLARWMITDDDYCDLYTQCPTCDAPIFCWNGYGLGDRYGYADRSQDIDVRRIRSQLEYCCYLRRCMPKKVEERMEEDDNTSSDSSDSSSDESDESDDTSSNWTTTDSSNISSSIKEWSGANNTSSNENSQLADHGWRFCCTPEELEERMEEDDDIWSTKDRSGADDTRSNGNSNADNNEPDNASEKDLPSKESPSQPTRHPSRADKILEARRHRRHQSLRDRRLRAHLAADATVVPLGARRGPRAQRPAHRDRRGRLARVDKTLRILETVTQTLQCMANELRSL
ncbi:hypothetical protein F4680DRAFT_467099 [Xylaria scruposa]|nr:hypothetical protein F4680DRAFT_467099 [Xylaria scruposa]